MGFRARSKSCVKPSSTNCSTIQTSIATRCRSVSRRRPRHTSCGRDRRRRAVRRPPRRTRLPIDRRMVVPPQAAAATNAITALNARGARLNLNPKPSELERFTHTGVKPKRIPAWSAPPRSRSGARDVSATRDASSKRRANPIEGHTVVTDTNPCRSPRPTATDSPSDKNGDREIVGASAIAGIAANRFRSGSGGDQPATRAHSRGEAGAPPSTRAAGCPMNCVRQPRLTGSRTRPARQRHNRGRCHPTIEGSSWDTVGEAGHPASTE